MADGCMLEINKVDSALGNAFNAAQELDGFILYKNTTPIALSDESMAKLFLVNNARSLKGIGLYTKSGVPVAFTKEYYIMRDYLVNYSRKDNFMGLFRILYGEGEAGELMFKKFQKRVREDMDSFFSLIERGTERKEKQQEYFFRLIRLIRDDEYNDVKLLLALFPDMREVLTNNALFKKYFGVDFTDSRTYRTIRETIAKKGGIYANLPGFRLIGDYGKSDRKGLAKLKDTPLFNKAPLSSHTFYDLLPDDVKAFYFREKFKLPDGLEIQELTQKRIHYQGGDEVFITNDLFMKLSREDQEKLYDALFDNYKLSNPENAKLLEKHIENSKKYFTYIHGGWTVFAGVASFLKSIGNPIWYAATLIFYKLPVGLISMLALNSWLHLPRYLANENMNLHFSGDWGKFCKQQGIFKRDIQFWDLIKRGFRQGDYKNSFQYMFVGMNRAVTEFAEAQFFNIADTAMTAYYRMNLAEEYLSVRFPFMKSFDEYGEMLSMMSKDEREKEISQFVKYIDDKMYTRYNNSLDTTRYTKSRVLPSEINLGKLGKINLEPILSPAQEVYNLISGTFKFYRRFMITYNNSIMGTIKEGWNGHNQKQLKEVLEQFYSGKKTRDEVSGLVYDVFGKNQDLQFLINTALYSFMLAKNIFKYDIHGNGEDENEIADAALINEFLDLYKLFFFPREAWERTGIGMGITAMFDAMALDLSLEDNIKTIAGYEYKTYTKQLAKSQWFLRGLVKLASDHVYNEEQRDELSSKEKFDRIINDINSTIWGYGYYLLDNISRDGFEEYTPKTQTALLKQIFGTREYSIKMFDDISKKQGILKIGTRDDFTNWLTYNTPYAAQFAQGKFLDTTGVQKALQEWFESPLYRTMVAEGILPEGITDEEYYDFYIMMTQYNPKDKDTISRDFLVDWSWNDKDTGEKQHDYEKEAKEKIWHDLMLDNVDEDLVKEAIRLLSTAEKDYQAQALTALMYLEAQTPGAGQKLLGYYVSAAAANKVFFSGKYGYFKKQDDGSYSIIDQAKINDAFRKEGIQLAKDLFNMEYILDKEIWAQASLKVAKDSNLSISNYIKDLKDNGYGKLGIYPERIDLMESRSERLKNLGVDEEDIGVWTNTDLYEVYKLYTYTNIAAAEGMPDGFKMYNMFSKLFSASGKKDENGKLTEEGAKSMLYAYNSLLELVDGLGISDVEKTVIMSSALLQTDQFISRLMEGKTNEEIMQDPYIQTALHFLWGDAQLVNALADRKISEIVQKKNTGTDPEEISLSWVTKSKGTNKHGYSSWKPYYTKNQYFYDQVKYMTSKYHKYYNYLYTPKTTNVKSYYSKAERDAKKFGPALATIKGSGGGGRRDNKQEKSGGSLTQRRGKARPFTNRGDLDKIPDRRTKPKNRRTRAYAVGSKLWNKLIPGRRRYIKARQRDIPTIS